MAPNTQEEIVVYMARQQRRLSCLGLESAVAALNQVTGLYHANLIIISMDWTGTAKAAAATTERGPSVISALSYTCMYIDN